MISDGFLVGDGSWTLRIYVTDLQVERTLRVKGDLHIGGVMLNLVDALDVAMDWSDHALWWPAKNQWLSRTRSTLDQCGVQADALLHFTPMHKNLRIQLPDLRYLDSRLDFSVKTFSAVISLCKELGVRHPEELSLCKPLEPAHLKHNYSKEAKRRAQQHHAHGHAHSENGGGAARNGSAPLPPDTNTFIASSSPDGSNGSLDKVFLCAPVTPQQHARATPPASPWTPTNGYSNGHHLSLEQLNGNQESALAHSPATPSLEARSHLVRPKTLVEKARMNVAWLDSSLSIMEQGVREFDTLCLRFKFYSFYDLNPKYDAVRINQIYEQAKWQLLNEEIDCTEEEMLMFAALQVQVNVQANLPQPSLDNNGSAMPSPLDDDIDAALTDLQVTLEGSNISAVSNDITRVPELVDYLRFLKPKRFTLKAFKRYWFTCRDLQLIIYKSREDERSDMQPVFREVLKGCEVTPDVNLTQRKYGIKLEIPGPDGMTEILIRCESEQQYAKWMAAFRLAAKGRTLADSSYETEVRTIENFLQMQHPAEAPVIDASMFDIQPEDYVAPRYLRKFKGKLVQKIFEAHANVKDLTLVEAKQSFIKAWQSLPEYGISLFVIKFMGHKKEELLGVAHNRIMKMDISTGDHLKTWRYNSVKAWNVNWEVKHMMIQFEGENIVFSCQSADCKVIHEFIGGYIFLSMRSKEANQTLNEDLFHKLTSGWS